LFNQVNGVWARVHGDHVDFGLSDMVMMTLDMVGPDERGPGDAVVRDWIPSPFGNDLLDLAEERVRCLVPASG